MCLCVRCADQVQLAFALELIIIYEFTFRSGFLCTEVHKCGHACCLFPLLVSCANLGSAGVPIIHVFIRCCVRAIGCDKIRVG